MNFTFLFATTTGVTPSKIPKTAELTYKNQVYNALYFKDDTNDFFFQGNIIRDFQLTRIFIKTLIYRQPTRSLGIKLERLILGVVK